MDLGQLKERHMPFNDHRVAKALDIFISRNEKLQRELANLSRHPGGLYVEELRIAHAQTAYLNAVVDQGTNPYDFALRFLARTPAELESLREQRRQELRQEQVCAHV
jgi:hypothetical protein